METLVINKISKEQLPGFSFSTEEVLLNEDDRKWRWRELNRGMTLGNLHKSKSKMYFLSSTGEMYQVDASIWSITAKYVILKGGILIPINSIQEVIV